MAFDEMQFDSWDQAEQKAMLAYELYENGSLDRALEELDEALEDESRKRLVAFQ